VLFCYVCSGFIYTEIGVTHNSNCMECTGVGDVDDVLSRACGVVSACSKVRLPGRRKRVLLITSSARFEQFFSMHCIFARGADD
jgi:hypothetical protein